MDTVFTFAQGSTHKDWTGAWIRTGAWIPAFASIVGFPLIPINKIDW